MGVMQVHIIVSVCVCCILMRAKISYLLYRCKMSRTRHILNRVALIETV